jgi:hypothetical protein
MAAKRKGTTRTARARAAAEDARRNLIDAAREAGVTVPAAPTTWGETWTTDREGRVRRTRLARAALPTALVALALLRDAVRAERRVDVRVPAKELRIDPETGGIWRMGSPAGRAAGRRSYRAAVLRQIAGLLRYAPRYAGSYWLDRPAPQRAVEFQDVVTTPCNDADEVVLRMRTPAPRDGVRLPQGIYAAVSTSFATYDPDVLAEDLRRILRREERVARSPWGDSTKAVVLYRGVETCVELISAKSADAGNLAVTVSTADDTSGAVNVRAALSLWSGVTFSASTLAAKVVHSGRDPQRFARGLRAGIQKATEMAAPFAELWTDRDAVDVGTDPRSFAAAVRHICGDVYGTDDAGKRVQTHRGWLRLGGVDPEQLSQAVLDAHAMLVAASSGTETPAVRRSIAGVAHAIAHCAKTGGWTEAQGEELLEAANALLLARPAAASVWFGLTGKGETRVADANLELTAEIARLRGEVADWERIAADARESGDVATAEEAEERAELLLVKGDLEQERRAV